MPNTVSYGNRKKNNSVKKGFSIGEVLLAAFVLVVGLISIIQLMSKSTVQSIDSRNAIIASELSQEGIELVRNIRDNNWLSTPPGSFGGVFPNASMKNCLIDKDTPLSNCNNGVMGSRNLYIDSNGFYVHSSSGTTATPFQRKISLQYDNPPPTTTQVTVISKVVWGRTDGDFPTVANCSIGSKCVLTQDVLTKWGE